MMDKEFYFLKHLLLYTNSNLTVTYYPIFLVRAKVHVEWRRNQTHSNILRLHVLPSTQAALHERGEGDGEGIDVGSRCGGGELQNT